PPVSVPDSLRASTQDAAATWVRAGAYLGRCRDFEAQRERQRLCARAPGFPPRSSFPSSVDDDSSVARDPHRDCASDAAYEPTRCADGFAEGLILALRWNTLEGS